MGKSVKLRSDPRHSLGREKISLVPLGNSVNNSSEVPCSWAREVGFHPSSCGSWLKGPGWGVGVGVGECHLPGTLALVLVGKQL